MTGAKVWKFELVSVRFKIEIVCLIEKENSRICDKCTFRERGGGGV